MARTVQEEIDYINQMSQKSMATLWRFASAGHPYFDSKKPYWKVFIKRFEKLGRITPKISKEIGL